MKIKFNLAQISVAIILCCCKSKETELNLTEVITLQDAPTFERLYEKKSQDSVRFHVIIDSIFQFTTKDSSRIPFLDQCYWEFHRRTLKIVPIYNKRGFSTTEADKKAEWLFEKKTVDCGNMGTKQTEFNKVEFVDSTCELCFLLHIDPFDMPIQYVTLNKKSEMIFTESYARSYILGLPRLVKKYNLDFLDQKEIYHIIKGISAVAPEDSSVGFDGTSISLGAVMNGKKIKISKWCSPKDLSELWRFIERKMKVKLSRC